MARSATFSGSFGGDPLANLERSRAEASGKRPTKRELLEMGNRPVPELPRAAPKPLDVFLAEEAAPKNWSPARKRAEALFDAPREPAV